MSEKQITHLVRTKYPTITRTELARKDPSLYNVLKRRNLRHIISSKIRSTGFFSKMNNTKLLHYLNEHYSDMSKSQIHSIDYVFMREMRKRKLTGKILIPRNKNGQERKPNGFYSRMNEDQLLHYCNHHHPGETIGKIAMTNRALYRHLQNSPVKNKLFHSKNKPHGYYKKMSDEELWDYTTHLYGENISSSDLKGHDESLMREIFNRGINDRFTLRKRKEGYFKKWLNMIQEYKRILKKNNGEFPDRNTLDKQGFSSFFTSANKYWGGISIVRERLGYNQQKREQLARQLEEIVCTIEQ